MNLTVEQRVAAGAAWLDDKWPAWWKQIDLTILDVGNSCDCVMGQIVSQTLGHDAPVFPYGLLLVPSKTRSGSKALTELGISFPGRTRANRITWAKAHGFHGEGDYEALTGEWRKLVKTREAS